MSNGSPRPPSSPAWRLVLGTFILLSAAFIGSTIAQVVPAVFHAPSGVRSPEETVSPACAEGIALLREGVDDAVEVARTEPDARSARAAYNVAKTERWKDFPSIERTCQDRPSGEQAIAALARFERAASAMATRDAERVGQVRREVDSYIRPALR